MNGLLTFGRLREQNVMRCGQSFHPVEGWSPTDWATAMAGETGEACNFVKKLRRLEDGPDKPYNLGVDEVDLKEQIGKELADVVIYADLLAARLGISLERAVIQKFNEVSHRMKSNVRVP